MIAMNTAARSMSTLLVVILLFGAARGDGATKKVPTQPEIDKAVDAAVKFLLEKQEGDGSFGKDIGRTSLALYALSHSGLTEKDKPVAAAVRWILTHMGSPGTYEASLAVMALATVDRAKYAKPIRRLAKLIQAGQLENGQWSYKLRTGRSSGDNSNTQFAILALWYARGAGAKLDRKTFERTLKFFSDSQNEDGGWGYSAKERKKSYGSMTAAGLAALVIGRAGAERRALKEKALREHSKVRLASAWLTKNFRPDRNPNAKFKLGGKKKRKEITDTFWRYYWLWSLERAASLAGMKKLGERDWYGEGARFLLDQQRDDGSWVGSSNAVHTTCFALLFLKRAMRRAVATEPVVEKGTTTPGGKK
jgi:squalene cyclase